MSGVPIPILANHASVDSILQNLDATPSKIQYQDEREQLNSALQIEFIKNLGESRNTTFYEKVAVLLLSWDAKYNDLQTQGEVCDRFLP